jgi:hypothetical protein
MVWVLALLVLLVSWCLLFLVLLWARLTNTRRVIIELTRGINAMLQDLRSPSYDYVLNRLKDVTEEITEVR